MTGRNAAVVAGLGGGLGLAALGWARRPRPADLTGDVALVTGGSRGLGLLLAREFGRAGCRVAVCARDEAELQRACRQLERERISCFGWPCDVSDPQQVGALVQNVRSHYGRVDILVNNAGTIQVGPVENMAVADFEEAMRVMFWGMLYPTLEALPGMLERGSGRIANITSIGGKVAVPHLLPYISAKFAAVGFSEGLRAELRREGIQVTTIVPGLMRTGSFLNAFFKGSQEREFNWFSLGSALPGISMDAERAARQVVAAVRRGQSERVLSLPAKLLANFHALFPGLTSDLLGLVNQLALPEAAAGGKEQGRDIRRRSQSKVRDSLTALGLSAAARFNQGG